MQYVVRADSEREAMNALMQQIIDIVLAKRQGSVVWRVMPYVAPMPHPDKGYVAKARFCVV